MNYTFKKKPVIVEAFQMTKERRWDNKDWPNWLNEAWNLEPTEKGCLFCIDGREQLYISTLEGDYKVLFNDYIIQGVQDELYPCKPDIFKKTYEEV